MKQWLKGCGIIVGLIVAAVVVLVVGVYLFVEPSAAHEPDLAILVPTVTPEPEPTGTAEPEPTETAVPTPTMTPVVQSGLVNAVSNLRAGPGTDFEIVGSITAGMEVALLGRNDPGDWLFVELANSQQAWIALFLVDSVDVATLSVPVPTRTPRPTATPAPDTWYRGGTLFDATLAQWRAADDKNKLATAAGWAIVVYKPTPKDEIELGAIAILLSLCVDEVADDPELLDLGSMKANEIAAACLTLMQ